MKQISVHLTSEPSKSFRATKAANSLDIDIKKKLTHSLTVSADVDSPYNVGLIIGASGSGKTTLAKQLFGDKAFFEVLDLSRPVIDQFPETYSYDDCANALNGVGLTQVPCWIRPAFTLSNGQRARAEIALQMSREAPFVAIDEWTSVVDRTVAKVMSHCIAKHARREGRSIVLCSCHYDVVEWLNPDWVIDCNKQAFIDRRLLWREFQRSEKLSFEIREVDRSTWRYFSKYHYLSDKLPGGLIYTFGLFFGAEQVGFQCFANYVPTKTGSKITMHFNRTVIHPDYAGLGLGVRMINETARIMKDRGFNVMGKFSSAPVKRSLDKHSDKWRLISVQRVVVQKKTTGSMGRGKVSADGFRQGVKTYSYRYIGAGAAGVY